MKRTPCSRIPFVLLLLIAILALAFPFAAALPSVKAAPGRVLSNESASSGELEVRLVGQMGGSVYDVAIQDRYAYLGVGPRLAILDITDPAAPLLVAQSGVLPGVVQGLAVSGGYAYVADNGAGLRIIDISNPAAPTETGFYDTPGSALHVAVQGGYIYIADEEGGLAILTP